MDKGNALSKVESVVMTYDLPERLEEEVMPTGKVYTIKWRGDEIIGISPQDEPFPFYPAI
ncbi:MAG: hypothetical protein HRT89_24265 [Lentisphaeria bacterium]|nr:hypothetical protein [Lentisphaeria bacterium]NQZ71172.1 hypothetical protein [Lentisphaeria bacterium]